MKDYKLLQLVLPVGILDFFHITDVEEGDEGLYVYLEEKNNPPKEYKDSKLKAHGFHQEATIRDFPLRGKACFLKVKRRRWLLIDTGKVISRDWDIVASGTRITEDFAFFLKGINR